MEFDALLNELGAAEAASTTLAKAIADGEFEMGADGKPKCDKEGKPIRKGAMLKGDANPADPALDPDDMSKSFQVTLPSGETADAIDATEMLKAMSGDVESLRTAVPRMLAIIKGQGDMLKSLNAQISALANVGTGRRSVVTVSEKIVANAQPAAPEKKGIGIGEFMMKAQDCVAAGKLDSNQAAILDAYAARGQTPPDDLVRIVMGGLS